MTKKLGPVGFECTTKRIQAQIRWATNPDGIRTEYGRAARLPGRLLEKRLGEHPDACCKQATDDRETKALHEAKEVEAIVAVAWHALRPGKNHHAGLDGAEEQPVQDQQVKDIENQQNDHGEGKRRQERDRTELAPQGGQAENGNEQEGRKDCNRDVGPHAGCLSGHRAVLLPDIGRVVADPHVERNRATDEHDREQRERQGQAIEQGTIEEGNPIEQRTSRMRPWLSIFSGGRRTAVLVPEKICEPLRGFDAPTRRLPMTKRTQAQLQLGYELCVVARRLVPREVIGQAVPKTC